MTRLASRLTCIATAVIYILLAIGLLIVVPEFTGIFEDFDTDLSILTTNIVGFYLLLAGASAFCAVVLIAKEIVLHQQHVLTLIINLFFVLLFSFIFAVLTVGLLLPFARLMQSVQ